MSRVKVVMLENVEQPYRFASNINFETGFVGRLEPDGELQVMVACGTGIMVLTPPGHRQVVPYRKVVAGVEVPLKIWGYKPVSITITVAGENS